MNVRALLSIFRRKPPLLTLNEALSHLGALDQFIQFEIIEFEKKRLLVGNKSDVRELVYFSIANAIWSTKAMIMECPSVAKSITQVLTELRIYYECLWQLVLLNRFKLVKDRVDVASLYPWVQLGTIAVKNRMLSAAPDLRNFVEGPFGSLEQTHFLAAVHEYINGKRITPIPITGDMIRDNVETIVTRITLVCKIASLEQINAVRFVMNRETIVALDSALLNGFDVTAAASYKMPPEWLARG